jgi:hypothetical protein
LSQDQLILLRASRVPYTGNRLLTALKLTGASITALADATCLRYRRLAALVAGRGIVPAGYPEEIASTFGCLPSDLFPLAADAPAPTRHVETPDADAAGDGLDHPSGHRARATAPA